MKLRQGILISLISFVAGGVLTYFVFDYMRMKSSLSSPKKQLTPITKNDFTKPKKKTRGNDNDPFQQMDQMHKQMRKRMDKFFGRSFGNSMFDIDPFTGSSFTTNNIKINRYEDDQFKYIEIAGEGVSKESLEVNISDGMVSISGEIKQTEENNNSGTLSKSSYVSKFNQSFNVPSGVEEENVSIESEDNKLIIKFPKERI